MYNSPSNLHHLEKLVSDLVNQISLLTAENRAIKERLAYLEWDLHEKMVVYKPKIYLYVKWLTTAPKNIILLRIL